MDPLQWWASSRTIYPKLAKMARDVYTIPATGAGVEREFSISGRLITKHRNRLAPKTIRDLMQYKRWVARYVHEDGDIANDEENDGDSDEKLEIEPEDDDEINKDLLEWLRNWEKKQSISEQMKRLASS